MSVRPQREASRRRERKRSRRHWLREHAGRAVVPQRPGAQRERVRGTTRKPLKSRQPGRPQRRRPQVKKARKSNTITGEDCGSKSSSIRFSTRLQQRLAFALVCEETVRRISARGSEAKEKPQAALRRRRCVARRYRTSR